MLRLRRGSYTFMLFLSIAVAGCEAGSGRQHAQHRPDTIRPLPDYMQPCYCVAWRGVAWLSGKVKDCAGRGVMSGATHVPGTRAKQEPPTLPLTALPAARCSFQIVRCERYISRNPTPSIGQCKKKLGKFWKIMKFILQCFVSI